MSRELPQPLHDLDVVLPWPSRRAGLPVEPPACATLAGQVVAAPVRATRGRAAYVAGWWYGLLCGTFAGALLTVGALRVIG